jgi:O-antigen ligase
LSVISSIAVIVPALAPAFGGGALLFCLGSSTTTSTGSSPSILTRVQSFKNPVSIIYLSIYWCYDSSIGTGPAVNQLNFNLK